MGKTINKMKSTKSYREKKKKKPEKIKKKKCPFDESAGEEKSRRKLLTICTQFSV